MTPRSRKGKGRRRHGPALHKVSSELFPRQIRLGLRRTAAHISPAHERRTVATPSLKRRRFLIKIAVALIDTDDTPKRTALVREHSSITGKVMPSRAMPLASVRRRSWILQGAHSSAPARPHPGLVTSSRAASTILLSRRHLAREKPQIGVRPVVGKQDPVPRSAAGWR